MLTAITIAFLYASDPTAGTCCYEAGGSRVCTQDLRGSCPDLEVTPGSVEDDLGAECCYLVYWSNPLEYICYSSPSGLGCQASLGCIPDYSGLGSCDDPNPGPAD